MPEVAASETMSDKSYFKVELSIPKMIVSFYSKASLVCNSFQKFEKETQRERKRRSE